MELRTETKFYLRRRVLKGDVLGNKVLSFHNSCPTPESPSSNHTRSLHKTNPQSQQTYSLDTCPHTQWKGHYLTWWCSILVAVLFQVSTVSSGARPARVMRFFVLGTYTGCL